MPSEVIWYDIGFWLSHEIFEDQYLEADRWWRFYLDISYIDWIKTFKKNLWYMNGRKWFKNVLEVLSYIHSSSLYLSNIISNSFSAFLRNCLLKSLDIYSCGHHVLFIRSPIVSTFLSIGTCICLKQKRGQTTDLNLPT